MLWESPASLARDHLQREKYPANSSYSNQSCQVTSTSLTSHEWRNHFIYSRRCGMENKWKTQLIARLTYETPKTIQSSLVIGTTQAESPVMVDQRPAVSSLPYPNMIYRTKGLIKSLSCYATKLWGGFLWVSSYQNNFNNMDQLIQLREKLKD